MYQNLCVCVYVLLLWLPFNVDAEYFVLVMKGGGGGGYKSNFAFGLWKRIIFEENSPLECYVV